MPLTPWKNILLGIASDALTIQQCGSDVIAELGFFNRRLSSKMAKGMTAANLLYITDTIERNLWKFDSDGLDNFHVFNEIMVMCFDRSLNPAYPSNVDIVYIKQKIDTLLKATDTLVSLQQKSIKQDREKSASQGTS